MVCGVGKPASLGSHASAAAAARDRSGNARRSVRVEVPYSPERTVVSAPATVRDPGPGRGVRALASIHRSIRSACFRPDCCTRSFPWCVRAWASCCSPVLRLVRGSWARGRGSGWPRGPSGCGPGLGWSGRCGGRAAGRSEEVQPFLLPVPAFGQVQGDVPAAVPGGAGGHGDQVAADGRGPGFGEGAAG